MTMPWHTAVAAACAAALALGVAGVAADAAAATPKKAKKSQPAKAGRPVAAAEPAQQTPDTLPRDEVMRFGIELAERNGLDAAWVLATLADARAQPAVIKAVLPPPAGTAKNWAAYRARFVEPRRIEAGVAFWRANEGWLLRAEDVYGVPPEIVVGIVGVETIYGQQMGNFRAVDALATLAFAYPPGGRDRSAFFRAELGQLFILCRSATGHPGCDPLALKSSYAGALGMPQFMPGSINRYALDFDGDGRIDLHDSSADVIGSVAHYLAEYGWRRGVPTHFAVAAPVDSADRALLLGPDIVPGFTAEQFAQHGAKLAAEAQGFEGLLALVELQNGAAAPSFVAGTSNFYAITRYNQSSYYALAVIELGAAVKRRIGEVR